MGTVTGVNIPVLSFVLLEEIHIIECHASVYGPSYEMGYWVVGEFMRFPHPMPTFEKGDFCGWVWMMFPKETPSLLGAQSGCYRDPL